MPDTILNKRNKWINVLENGIDNTGAHDVVPKLKELINQENEFTIFYFPEGTYLFETELEINVEITLQGDTSLQGNPCMGFNTQDSYTGRTNFITNVKDKDFTMIKLVKKKQCIKNINFYSDSCKVQVNHEPPTYGKPGYHYEIIANTEHSITAIAASDNLHATNLLGHYEDLCISGFSGTGIYIPYYSICDNLTVSNCGIGIASQSDVIISNCRVIYCRNGISLGKSNSLNNIKVEKIQRVGIACNTGGGRLMSIMIDECGHCGFSYGSLADYYFSGIIRRCGQYFYNTDYDTFLTLLDSMNENDRNLYKNAYSLLYGNSIGGGNIELIGGNKNHWNDDMKGEHKLFIYTGNTNKNVILRCSKNNLNMSILTHGESLIFYNNENNYFYKDGILTEINGIKPAGGIENGIIGIKYYLGSLDKRFELDYAQIRTDNNIKPVFHPMFAMLVASTDPDIKKIEETYGAEWTYISSEVIGKETVYYFKLFISQNPATMATL